LDKAARAFSDARLRNDFEQWPTIRPAAWKRARHVCKWIAPQPFRAIDRHGRNARFDRL